MQCEKILVIGSSLLKFKIKIVTFFLRHAVYAFFARKGDYWNKFWDQWGAAVRTASPP